MFTIQGLDHIVLRTNHIKEMLYFYCDILGCTIEREQPKINLTQLRAGSNLIDIVEVDTAVAQENQNLEHYCLRIQPFDFTALKAHFEQQGLEVKRFGERYGSQGLGPSFYINDPQGNEVELSEYRP